jgi:hypothetical protein
MADIECLFNLSASLGKSVSACLSLGWPSFQVFEITFCREECALFSLEFFMQLCSKAGPLLFLAVLASLNSHWLQGEQTSFMHTVHLLVDIFRSCHP